MNKKTQQNIGELVATIASSYSKHQDTIHLDANALPSKDVIIEVVSMLRALIFPGFLGRQNLKTETFEYYIGDMLINIYEKLYEQIGYALKHQAVKKQDFSGDIDDKANGIIQAFFAKIPEVREVLATDVQAAYDGDPATDDTSEIIFSYPGIFAVSIYRLAHELHRLGVPLIPRIMTEYAHSVTGIDIHAGAAIGRHFFIDHGTGVVIGETTVIGDHVKIYQGVTLGALSVRGGQALRGVKRHPTLQDRVTVYSGASIFGGETVIGAGAVIGSNVFITKSVAADTKVSMKSPELVFKGHSEE
jgi:serine O-acetyltransferase